MKSFKQFLYESKIKDLAKNNAVARVVRKHANSSADKLMLALLSVPAIETFFSDPSNINKANIIANTLKSAILENDLHEVNIPDFKGWVNPKTGKTRIIQGHTPYHVQMIVKDPKFYGIKETDIHDVLTKEALANNAPDEFRAETAATRELDDLKSGRQDVSVMVESLIIEKGWVRVVSGKFGEITSAKKYSASSKELRKILQMLDKETDITNMSDVDVGLQTHKKKSDKRVQVTPYDNLKIQDIRNIVKGRKRGDKQTEIGRTMAMFR